MQENSSIFDLNTVDKELFGVTGRSGFAMFNIDKNNEIVFTFGTSSYRYRYLSHAPAPYDLGFRVSYMEEGSLLRSYEEEDLRLQAYFAKDKERTDSWDYNWNYPIKYQDMSPVVNYHENWRNVEVLLNLAEAYARKANNVSEEAIGWLNRLRKNRIDKAVYEDLSTADFANKEELVKFIWAERRRELCFEEHMRFWDLRRQGRPRIVHKLYIDQTTYETYVLEEGSPNYVLSIPKSEMKYNSGVSSNPRVQISAQ